MEQVATYFKKSFRENYVLMTQDEKDIIVTDGKIALWLPESDALFFRLRTICPELPTGEKTVVYAKEMGSKFPSPENVSAKTFHGMLSQNTEPLTVTKWEYAHEHGNVRLLTFADGLQTFIVTDQLQAVKSALPHPLIFSAKKHDPDSEHVGWRVPYPIQVSLGSRFLGIVMPALLTDVHFPS